jgi:hypothetical protein
MDQDYRIGKPGGEMDDCPGNGWTSAFAATTEIVAKRHNHVTVTGLQFMIMNYN